jgi:hypothetical protein
MEIKISNRILYLLIGFSTILVHFLHIFTDIIEIVSGFSFYQLVLTYIVFLFIPFVILGLYAVHWPKGGWLGLIGSILYAISFIYFSSTAIYAINAIKNGTSNYEIIYKELGAVYFLHGGLMVIGGILFSLSVIRAKIFPAMTGIIIIMGLLINAIVSILPITPMFQVVGSTVRNIGFIVMGIFTILYAIKSDNMPN